MNPSDKQTTSGLPNNNLYDPAVANLERHSVESVRKNIGEWTTEAIDGQFDTHVVVTRHGHQGLVLVPIDWYRDARASLGDPTDT